MILERGELHHVEGFGSSAPGPGPQFDLPGRFGVVPACRLPSVDTSQDPVAVGHLITYACLDWQTRDLVVVRRESGAGATAI